MKKRYCVVLGCCTIDKTFFEKDNSSLVSFGGKGGNQAIALAKAGIKTYILTKLSTKKTDKKYTKLQLKTFKKFKVKTKYIEFDRYHANDFTNITIVKNGNNVLEEHVDISQTMTVDYVRKHKKLIEGAEFVLLQMKVPIDVTRELIKICKDAGVKTVLTPCRKEKILENIEILEDVDFITCNEKEAQDIVGENKIDLILKKYPNKLIATLGSKGVKFHDGKKVIYEKALTPINVLDTTGAGDTFCANFVATLFDGKSIYDAVKKGVCASTLKIQRRGTQTGMPFAKERDEAFEKVYIEK